MPSDHWEFRCGERVLQWGQSAHEARLAWLRESVMFPSWRCHAPWTGSQHKPRELARETTLADVKLSLDTFVAEHALLQANYAYRLRAADGSPIRPMNDTLARCDARTWIRVSSGPGVCFVVKSHQVRFTPEEIDDLVARGHMRPAEEAFARRFYASSSYDELIHDLRDLQWFTLEDGRSIRAVRRAKPTCIVAQMQALFDFLSAGDEEILEARYIGTSNSRAYAAHLASLDPATRAR